MLSLTKTEKFQAGGVIVALVGAIVGAMLVEPIAIGIGVLGAGTAAYASFRGKSATTSPGTPTKQQKYSAQQVQTRAVSAKVAPAAKTAATTNAETRKSA